MSPGTLGEKIDVQRTIRRLIGEFQLRRHAHATTLPMVVNDPLGCECGRLRAGFWHSSSIIRLSEGARGTMDRAI
jgi:hypothetical protein